MCPSRTHGRMMFSIIQKLFHLARCECVREESGQNEVLAGEVGDGDVLEVGVVHPRLTGDEPGPTSPTSLSKA